MNPKIAYVVKRYPRFSETFIVNEILAHEKAGLGIDIFSLRPPVDTHFQDLISRVRAPLTYLSEGRVRGTDVWEAMKKMDRASADWSRRTKFMMSVEDVLDVYCGLRLAEHCLRRGITHIHSHFASSSATVACIASSLTNIPFSITAHAKDIFHESVDDNQLAEKLARASVTFTVSEFNLRYLRQKFPAASHRVVRLYNGMHLSDFPYLAPVERAPKIVAVGRFVEKKGFSDLLKGCRILSDRGIAYECQLIGGGELEASLNALRAELHLEAEVQLLGPQPQCEVKRRIQQASVLAAPCIEGDDGNRDGLPTVLLESMALGTPCVSTAVTGIPEAIRHARTGIIVEERSPVSLANAIQELLTNAQTRILYASEARKLIEEEFDIDKNTAVQREYFLHAEGAGTKRTVRELEAVGS